MKPLVLASTSAARRAMLTAAGVAFEAIAPNVDEAAAQRDWGTIAPRDLAARLAVAKARAGAVQRPDAIVLGGDSVVELDGEPLGKPGAQLAAQLRRLSGRTHRLHSAAVVWEDRRLVWSALETATLTVRPLSDAFIGWCVAADPAAANCAGGYRIEGPGAQLFERVEGSWFAVQGFPLLPFLGWAREHGLLAS